MYGLYAITNFIWIIGLYLSSATDYIVEQNYKLDFISDTAGAIGKNKKDTVKTADYAKGESSKNLILSSNKNAHIREKTLNEAYSDDFPTGQLNNSSAGQKKQPYKNNAKRQNSVSEFFYNNEVLLKAEGKVKKNKSFIL